MFPGSKPQGRSGGSKGKGVSSGSNQSSEGSVRGRVPVSPTGLCAVRKCTHSFPGPGHACAWNPGQWVKRDGCEKNVLSAREEGLPSQRGPAEARHLFRGKQEPRRKASKLLPAGWVRAHGAGVRSELSSLQSTKPSRLRLVYAGGSFLPSCPSLPTSYRSRAHPGWSPPNSPESTAASA